MRTPNTQIPKSYNKPKTRISDDSLLAGAAVVGCLGFFLYLIFGDGFLFDTDSYTEYIFSFHFLGLWVGMPLAYFFLKYSGFTFAFLYILFLALYGPIVVSSSSTEWLSLIISSRMDDDSINLGHRVAGSLTIGLMWFTYSLVVEYISGLIRSKASTYKKSDGVKILVTLTIVGIFFLSGDTLLARREKNLNSASLPNLPGVIVVPEQMRGAFKLHFQRMDKSGSLVYQQNGNPSLLVKADNLSIGTQKKYIFGENACLSGTPRRMIEPQPYKTQELTDINIRYGVAEFDRNNSNLQSPENDYTTLLYCFVINGDRYRLTRSDLQADTHIELYPAEDIIRSIVDQPQTYFQ